jgi:N-methylhydantoinase B/oxoprolinase/acetone carboxylase alpha subunit
VLTSQRVVDVLLKAFRACAASQGCMNNLTFGDESVGMLLRVKIRNGLKVWRTSNPQICGFDAIG